MSVQDPVLFAETVVAVKTSLGQTSLLPIGFSDPDPSADVTVVQSYRSCTWRIARYISFGHGGWTLGWLMVGCSTLREG